ncbi:MAG: glycosyltransferase family 4 protein [Vicinamibacteria bacterium]|nr:glycosyltransferase family 4 protein [Vicinamibacteria bacterium]
MRILHVTPFYEPFWAYGGMARSSASLCRALAARGHQVTVVTALLGEGVPREAEEENVRVLRFPGPALPARFLFPLARGLRRFLGAELKSFDVMHLQGHRNGLAVTAWKAATAARAPWLLQTAGTFPHHGQRAMAKSLFDRVVGNRLVRDAGALVAVSASEARDLPRPAQVIPNGVDACGSPSSKLPPSNRIRLLFVGNDRPQKRGHLLVELLARLPEADVELVGPLGPSFQRLFAAMKGRVAFRGVLSGDDLARAYASADILVHPAVGEAFGLVPFEAALAGTAAVVAGGHGCGEWYGRAGGCVVPPDDVSALADATRSRFRDRGLAEQEARSVADFARMHLTWSAAAQAFESAYRELAGRA